MKKQFLLSLIFTLFCGIIYGQHLIRVNNTAGTDPDYTNLQDANDGASTGTGDTIYVEGSVTAYAGADISKKLVIIGPGFFLNKNDSTQANSLDAKFTGNINFNTGSAGSVITGIAGGGGNYIYIKVDNVVVTRCNVGNIYSSADVKNILISQNYVYSINSSSGKITDAVISNNIVTGYITFGTDDGPLQVTNNVVTGYSAISVYNSTIANNIICYSSGQITVNTGNNIINNILAVAGTNANGNKYNVGMTSVFVDYSGSLGKSDDAKWALKAGSPAIGAGVSGVDCGVFGGVTPYVLSGVPNLPHIYEAAIAGTAYSGIGLSCTIKIKSGK
jgi:hypothetical protein